MQEVISRQSALEILIEGASPSGSERVRLDQAGGRVVAEDVFSPVDLPLFENSAMDGFAVSSIDVSQATTRRPVDLEIIGESRAGHPSGLHLAPGQAVGISTGAMLPEGADSVIRIEEVSREGSHLLVDSAVDRGRDIRRRGEITRAGSLVFRAGVKLGPIELGALATVGHGHVSCYRRPRVTWLRQEGVSGGADQRMDSATQIVNAMVAASGAEVVDSGPVDADLELAEEAVRKRPESSLTLVCSPTPAARSGTGGSRSRPSGSRKVGIGAGMRVSRPVRRPWIMRRGEVRVLGLPDENYSAEVALRLLAGPLLRSLSGVRISSIR